MHIIWIVIIGFVAGVIAKLVHPGPNEPTGFILTTLLGIAGSFVATYLGQAIGWYRADQGAGFIGAVTGRRWRASSRFCRGSDDPGSEWDARMARGRAHRHAPRDERPRAPGPRGDEARSSRRRSLCVPGAPRQSGRAFRQRNSGDISALKTSWLRRLWQRRSPTRQ